MWIISHIQTKNGILGLLELKSKRSLKKMWNKKGNKRKLVVYFTA